MEYSPTMSTAMILFTLGVVQGVSLTPTEKLPEISGCGKAYLRGWKIVDDRNITFNQVPWNAVLTVNGTNGTHTLCDGALLNERIIVTRASCIHEQDISTVTAKLGTQTIEVGSKDHQPEYHDLRNKLVHEKFDPLAQWPNHDVALLELSTTVVFKRHIAPVCLSENGADLGNMTIIAARIERPFEEGGLVLSPSDRVNITGSRFCALYFPHDTWQAHKRFSEDYICAVVLTDSPKTSFGPILFEKDGYAHLVGFRSTPIRCLEPMCGALYTSISNDTDWITARMQPDFDFSNPRAPGTIKLSVTAWFAIFFLLFCLSFVASIFH